MGLAINLAPVDAANSQSLLTGEEASVAFKDVVFLPLRLQHCRYDTNLGGHLIYDLAFKLHPAPGLWYGRQTKAVLMALAGPLAFFLGRRLGLSVRASLLCGSCIFLFPGFSSFSWLAMEAGLELLFGGLRSTSLLAKAAGAGPLPRACWGLACWFTEGAAFAPPVFILIGLRLWEYPVRRMLVPRSSPAACLRPFFLSLRSGGSIPHMLTEGAGRSS